MDSLNPSRLVRLNREQKKNNMSFHIGWHPVELKFYIRSQEQWALVPIKK